MTRSTLNLATSANSLEEGPLVPAFPDLEALKAMDDSAWTDAFCYLSPVAQWAAQKQCPTLSFTEIEEVILGAITKLARQIENVTSVVHLRALLTVIAKRTAIDALRKIKPATSLNQLIEEKGPEAEPADLVDASQECDNLERIDAALNGPSSPLDSLEKGLITDHFIHSLKYRELAAQHKLPLGTVAAKIWHAIRKIRAHVKSSEDSHN